MYSDQAFIRKAAARFATAREGNVALIFCLTLPVLLGLAGLGLDSAAAKK